MSRLPTSSVEYARTTRDFGPQEIEGLALWRRGTGPHWQDTDRSVSAGTGDAVAVADDSSGNARHLIQESAAERPTLSSAGPSLELDGSNDAMGVDYALDPYAGFALMAVIDVVAS